MNYSNRDLLVLFKHELMSPQAIEHEVELLHEMLHKVEHPENIAKFCELIDLNSIKISCNKKKVFAALVSKKEKPFVFVNCRN